MKNDNNKTVAMEHFLRWSEEAKTRFPNLIVCAGSIRNVKVKVEPHILESKTLKESIMARTRQNYKAEMLKDDSTVRAYRDLYWSLGIDPTKTRPSGEALLRRVLHRNEIPTISNVVDAYNLASLETIIPLSGFDQDLIVPPLEIRFSNGKDEFKGIGMDKPGKLTDKVLLVADGKQILCIYPYRDADTTKITEKTRNVLIVGYGAPAINKTQLVAAVEKALAYIEKMAGGRKGTVNVFQSNQQL
jgi:DNA/RNA-binding domain of Phe-tRNA-synthetase-like protein